MELSHANLQLLNKMNISALKDKTLEDAAGELKRGIENVEYACSAPEIRASFCSSNCLKRNITWARLAGGVLRQAGKAALAESMAL